MSGMQADDARIERGLLVVDRRQAGEKGEIADASKCAARRGQCEEPSSSHGPDTGKSGESGLSLRHFTTNRKRAVITRGKLS